MYVLSVSLFHCRLSMFCPMLSSVEVHAICRTHIRGGPPIVFIFLNVVHRKYLDSRALACKSLVNFEV